MQPSPERRAERIGVIWLLADMTLISAMAALVKMEGAQYPAIQLVFLRSVVGVVIILPLVWRHRREIRHTRHTGRHIFRITCNALALTGNFAALAALPLALVSAIGFTRPLVVMLLAVLLLGERISTIRWLGAALGLAGVLVMVAPGHVPLDPGLAAAFASVLFGSLAVVQTRALKDENTTVLMVFYTVGLSLISAVPAAMTWQPVQPADWAPLLAIGILAQLGQYCFLRAYQTAQANVLAPFGYLSIIFATATGYLLFGEVPRLTTMAGVLVILLSLHITRLLDNRRG
ncbi:DMT family transporter [Chelativorans intermedius]|uniref:DMT family transporter n=1 Tax=Chelativorans intermedius TaxID=515947 RepID=A0ABV6D2P1_9HYPH|nr:DMT family transporter [Chelativorans intermedius]MCT8997272.1 DMT family transporter [Chelativorans intermedius]